MDATTSTPHTVTAREFGQNVSNARRLAEEGPVFITNHGEPTFVLLNIKDYRELARDRDAAGMSLLQLMESLPDTSEAGEFVITPLGVESRGKD